MAISQSQPLLLLVLVSLFFFPTLGLDFTTCASFHQYEVKVSDLKLSPHPVKYNETTQIMITANTSNVISEGAIVKFESWPPGSGETYSSPYSLCEVTKCPVATGPFVLTFSTVVPSDAYSGTYIFATISITEKKPRVKDMMCIKFLITID